MNVHRLTLVLWLSAGALIFGGLLAQVEQKVGTRQIHLDFHASEHLSEIEACHEIDVFAPIYFTVGWSHNDALKHPEWCARREDGSIFPGKAYKLNAKPGTSMRNTIWLYMCLNTRLMVETDMPSLGRVSLLHQADKEHYMAQLLYAPPIQRGAFQVIEDLPTHYDVPVIVDLPLKVKKAVLIPEKKALEIIRDGSKVSVTVPSFSCHSAVLFEY